MKDKKRLIMLISLAVIVVVVLAISATYAFMKASSNTREITTVSIQSCAKIKLIGDSSINLTNSYAMSRNVALTNEPYIFTVEATCNDDSMFQVYLATLNTNTLPNSDIHYIIMNSDNQVLSEGILSNATTASLTTEEIRQLNSGINGTASNVYIIYNHGSLPIDNTTSYQFKLYLYIDENATLPNSSKTFSAGIAVKAAPYTPSN